jgi:four helix bundle protein
LRLPAGRQEVRISDWNSEIKNDLVVICLRKFIKGGKDMNQEEIKQRTKLFALGIIQLVESLPKGRTTKVLGGQLLRSGTSVGSNYRSACRAKSIADFISKMGIVEEEVDESLYWMELLIEVGIEVNMK